MADSGWTIKSNPQLKKTSATNPRPQFESYCFALVCITGFDFICPFAPAIEDFPNNIEMRGKGFLFDKGLIS